MMNGMISQSLTREALEEVKTFLFHPCGGALPGSTFKGAINSKEIVCSTDLGVASFECRHIMDIKAVFDYLPLHETEMISPLPMVEKAWMRGQCEDVKVYGMLKHPVKLETAIFRNGAVETYDVILDRVLVANLPVPLHVSDKRLENLGYRLTMLRENATTMRIIELPGHYQHHPYWHPKELCIALGQTKYMTISQEILRLLANEDGSRDSVTLRSREAPHSVINHIVVVDYSDSSSDSDDMPDLAPLDNNGNTSRKGNINGTEQNGLLRGVNGEEWVINTAQQHGYVFAGRDVGTHMIAFEKGDNRLNFWLSTGTVGSYLYHPSTPGGRRTQLFRRDVDRAGALEIIRNPRVHTGKGYSTKKKARVRK